MEIIHEHDDPVGAMAELGFSIFPVRPRDKKPAIAWKRYQTEPATSEDLQAWFGNGQNYNIGIVAGAISGIVVVDTDTDDAEQWAQEQLPSTPLMVRTAKGVHRYYRHPGGSVRNKARIRDGIDIRADGGYVLAPGSVHPSGITYELLKPLPSSRASLPVFNAEWIETTKPQVIEAAQPIPRRRTETTDTTRLVKRARAYLEKVPPAIEGQGGDARTFTTVCRIVRGFDLADAEAFDVLTEWNQTCVPPWSDHELEEKIQNARKYGTEPLGGCVGSGGHGPVEHTHGENVTFPFTDAGNAEYFAGRCGDRLRFDHQRARWLEWGSPIWRPDADASVRRLAKVAMRGRYHDAGAIEDPDARKKASNWAIASENRSRLDALLYLAQAEPPFADTGENWDSDPDLLACPNGVVDLRTGSLRPGRQTDRLTMLAGVPYDPAATCPRFIQFLFEVFDGNQELIEYMHRVIGYCLTGHTTEQCWWMWWGFGANGKSTLIRALQRALGDFGACAPFSTFLYQPNATLTNDLARLRGRRFVWAQEASQTSRLDEERIKTVTGGDTVTARFLHREFFEFQPTLKLVLAVNKKPVVKDDSFGTWRRVRVVPFTQRFDIDKTLDDELAGEAQGILAWAVRGALLWHGRP